MAEELHAPPIPEEVKQKILQGLADAGYEQCETAWHHLLNCQQCQDTLYLALLGAGVNPMLEGLGYAVGQELGKAMGQEFVRQYRAKRRKHK